MAEMLVQSESLTNIADEIRILSGTEDPMSLDSMKTNVAEANTNVDTEAELIAQISAALEGKTSFDASDATAVANDIYSGKTAYVNGEKLTGTMYVARGGITANPTPTKAGGMPYVNMTHSVTQRTIIDPEQGSTITLQAPFTDFGDAAAADVAVGKTFTSAAGLKIEGTMEAALAPQYVDETPSASSNALVLNYTPGDSTSYHAYRANISIRTSLANLGDATANDVAAGKTFTSTAGLKVTGTMEAGVELPTLENPGSASDLAKGKQLIDADGNVVEGSVNVIDGSEYYNSTTIPFVRTEVADTTVKVIGQISNDIMLINKAMPIIRVPNENFGNATPADVRQGVKFTSAAGLLVEGEALIPGGGSVYPDGAFTPVNSFTDGKQYALVSMIGGVRRYINTTDYNQYTMNATEITIGEDAGDYVIFSETPALFTAVASGDGFLLQNGTNYLHGTSSGGTALRVGTTQAVWTVDSSETGGFSEGKYNAKEDANAVWLMNASDGYNWSIKYETAGSFGYDREGRDNTYSTGFVPFVLYEYVAGEGEISPIVDTSDASVTANQMLVGASGYAKGKLVEGNIQSKGAETIEPGTTEKYIEPGVYLAGRQTIAAIQTQTKTATANGTITPDTGKYLSSVIVNVPSSGTSLPEGAIAVQKVMDAQASTQIGSGYSLSVTYGDNVEIDDSIALAFSGTTQTLSNISATTDFSVLLGKYVRAGSSYGSTSGTFYYIPEDATFTVGGQSMSKTLTCDKAQKVSMQKVSV